MSFKLIQFRTLNGYGFRTLKTFSCLCKSQEDESIYERLEKGPQPRKVYGETYTDWRKPWIERQGEWKSKLSVFSEKDPSPEYLSFVQRIPDLTTDKIKNWWATIREEKEVMNQIFLDQRVEALGANLAAVHFFTYRGAAVRLRGSKDWLKGDPDELNIPKNFAEGYYVEAIDCTDFANGGIRYEGLQNLANLSMLKWLSLKNNKFVNVWALDRIAGLMCNNLEYLDISGCTIDKNCLHALCRMRNLKVLVVTDPEDDLEIQSGYSMLEEEIPVLLKIVPKDVPDDNKKQ